MKDVMNRQQPPVQRDPFDDTSEKDDHRDDWREHEE